MKIRNILVLLAGALLSLQSFAQASNWPIPNKPITFINPFPPGGAVDAFGRPLAKQLSTQMGTSIIVDNKGGAGGTVGAAAAAKMAPDGYTWLLGAVHHSIAPSMYTNLSYDITKDFEPVAIIGSVP
ncbi:Bug family tripartite tricarboxylate transporter substrate binding protein [Polynucleobacter sp. 31A-FELB]